MQTMKKLFNFTEANVISEKNMKKIIDIGRKLTYVFNIFLSIIIYPLCKASLPKKCWLIGLLDDVYANNGKVFYEYVLNKHSDIEIYWICEKKAKKYMSHYISPERLILRGKVKNYLFALNAEVALYGFSDRDIAPGFYRIFRKRKSVLVNLSHGYDGLKGMLKDYYKPMPADIICAASEYEKSIKVNHCGAEPNKVYSTGFARYDKWKMYDNKNEKIKKILIMPTWRDWYEIEKIKWEDSKLYSVYKKILKEIGFVCENAEIICHFHPRISSYYENPKIEDIKNVKFDNGEQLFQKLLSEADLVISDYSSIFWDALYMNKTVLLYWFDYDEYSQKRGLMADENFYPYIAKTETELYSLIKKYFEGELNISNAQKKYFDWQDKNNCDRIYSLIQKKINEKRMGC